MTIAFTCDNCGKDFQTDASLAGKKCKCKQCGHVFVIPAPRSPGSASSRNLKAFGAEERPAARPQPSSSASRPAVRPVERPAPKPSRPNYLDETDDPYGLDDVAPLPPRAGGAPVASADDEFRGPKPISSKPMRKKRASNGEVSGFFEGLPSWYYLGAIGILVAAFTWSLVSPSTGQPVFIGSAVLVGLVSMVYGGIGMLVITFTEGVVYGLLWMFAPFGVFQLYYIVTRWNDIKGVFLSNLFGVGVIVTSILFSGAMGAAFAAADRARLQAELRQGQGAPFSGVPADPGAPPPGFPGLAPPPAQLQPQPALPGFAPGFAAAPPQDGPADQTVTLEVTGLDDPDTTAYFGEKLGELKAGNMRGTGGGGHMTYTFWPVVDPKAFADRITFAKVTRVDGRTIHVVALPAAPGERRPPDSDFVGQILFDLKSPLKNRRGDAVRRLSNAPPDASHQAEIAKAIEPLLKDPDGFTRSEAAKALGIWGGPANTPALLETLRDPAFNVVWAAFDALERLKDPGTAEAVAAHLGVQANRGNAAKVLKAIGPPAEGAVIKFLDHGDAWVRMEAANILKEIGSEESVPALQGLIRKTNNQGLDAMAAGDALDHLGAPRFAAPPRTGPSGTPRKPGLVPRTRTRSPN